MKKFISLVLVMMMAITTAIAQNPDKIVGNYQAVRDGVTSKVKVFKHNGGYRAQVYWVDNLMMPDGSKRLDVKNPDASKRSVQADQIILIDKVVYKGNKKEDKWADGKIYDPTSGKIYTVTLYFKDDNTLTVKGSIGPFFQRMYWTRLAQ